MNTHRASRAETLAKYGCLLLGAAILAFGLYNVHRQSGITEGGVLGMTLLLNHWLGISPAISGFVMDVTCYLIGIKILGKQFAKYAIVASAGFALVYALLERFAPILPNMSQMPLAAAVLGGIFVGLGVGLVVMVGGASGGDDALALVISRRLKCKISVAYLVTDLTVLALSLTYLPITKIFFSLVTVTLSSFLIGLVQKLGLKTLRRMQHASVKEN